jgi:hypothetical protein
MSDELTPFARKLAEKRAQREAELRAAQKRQDHDADLIPEGDVRSDTDAEMDRIIKGIDILDAYGRWCGKMRPDVRGKTESIMISCPIPGHADKKPSAWINTDKQTWFCGGCNEGGDALDIAAYHFGYPVPGYKNGSVFHELRRSMAKDLGYTFTTLPGNVTEIIAPVGTVAVPEPTVDEAEETEEEEEPASVVDLYDENDYEETPFLPLNWRSFVPKDTYLDAYMRATCVDDIPEEFHFWNGLIGLGFALGREVRLADFVPVYGNLFVCTIGRSGAGKSRARAHLDKLLTQALPHDWNNPGSKGVRRVSSPGSAEVLIHNFQKPVEDPSNPKKIAYYAAVRGMIDFNELSVLVGKAARSGNVTIPVMMQFYDMENVIATSSMTHGSKEAHQPFASALTTTQPRSLRNLITKADDASGFLNRWIFAPGTEKKRFAIGGIAVNMTPVVPYLDSIVGWAASFGTDELMEWDADAAERFTQFFHQRVELDKKKSQSDLIIRIDLVLKKLILLFAANRKERSASLQSVEDAISCYDYLISSFRIPEAQIGNTLQNEVSEAVLTTLKKNPNGMTLNAIARSLHRRKYPQDLLLKTCDTLMKLGFITVETKKAGTVGRPSTRYKISA